MMRTTESQRIAEGDVNVVEGQIENQDKP